NQWINQVAINQQHIASANEVALNVSPLSNSGSYVSLYMPPPELWPTGGPESVTNPGAIVGWPWDDNCARFYTPLSNPAEGASVVGEMSSSNSQGYIYVIAKLGPTGLGQNGNYVIMWEYVNGAWESIGYGRPTATYSMYPGYVYIGYVTQPFQYTSIGVTTAFGGVDTYNDVDVDCVWASG